MTPAVRTPATEPAQSASAPQVVPQAVPQASLRVPPLSDPFVQEAERVADRVTQMTSGKTMRTCGCDDNAVSGWSPTLQRQLAADNLGARTPDKSGQAGVGLQQTKLGVPHRKCSGCADRGIESSRPILEAHEVGAGQSFSVKVQSVPLNLQLGGTNAPEERDADRFVEQALGTPANGTSGLVRSGFGAAPVVRRRSTTSPGVGPVPESVRSTLSGGGEPLGQASRRLFEPRMGVDFANVRIYSNQKAASSAAAVGADAYTQGNRIVFGKGMYQPGTEPGRRLLGHELAHVVAAQNFGTTGSARESGRVRRSIQAGGIRNSDDVLRKIRQTLRSGRWRVLLLEPLARALGGLILPMSFLSDRLMERLAERLKPVAQLYILGQEAFDPGAEVDLESNNFVFTCNCGWLDMGHVFNSAMVGYLESQGVQATTANINFSGIVEALVHVTFGSLHEGGGQRAYETTLAVEEGQQVFRERLEDEDQNLTAGQPGTGQSAFTLEDLRSNWEGAHFGERVARRQRSLDPSLLPILRPIGVLPGYDSLGLEEGVREMFQRCGSVHFSQLPPVPSRGDIGAFEPNVRALIQETLGTTYVTIRGRQERLPRQEPIEAWSRTTRPSPVRLDAARHFCS